MPIMTRMRESMPTILVALLVAFLITLVFDWGMDYTGIRARGGDVVGSINGREISYREFAEVLQEYTNNRRAQDGKELDENQLKQAREQVWQSLVTRELLSEEIEKLGIKVTDKEMVDWVWGENPPEDLRQSFVDSAGQFRRDLYEEFLRNPNQFLQDPQGVDPAFGKRWLANYEQVLRQRRAQERLQSIIQASVQVSEGEIVRRFEDQNIQYEFLYALFDANQLVKDEEVQVTDEALRAYYDDHLNQQKVDATRNVKYVQFREAPSADDSSDALATIEEIARRARAGEDFLGLVFTYDERPDSGAFFRHGELTPVIESAAFGARVGDIVGPLVERDGYHVLKVLADRKSDEVHVHASHILFSVDGSQDSSAVKASALNVAKLAKSGADFAELAKRHSKDPGSAERGGDLGWFGKGRMVKSFEDAAFSARPGQIVGPIRSQFGWHIIKVHERDSREIKIVDIVIPISISTRTKNDVYQRAADFAYNARENDFLREAQSFDFEVREATLREKAAVISGLGSNESAARWAFDNDVGEVSEPFSFTTGYAVFLIIEAKEAGVRPFEEAKEGLVPAARRELKIKRAMEIAAEHLGKLSPSDSLTKLQQTDPSISVKRAGPVTLAASIPGIGRDQNVFGALSGLSPGKISKPVESTRGGAYLLQLLSRTAFDSTAYRNQRETLRTQLLQERRARRMNEWIAKLKETADIEDNRDQFFR